VIANILLWTFTHNYLGAILLMFTALVHVQHLVTRSAWAGLNRRASFLRLSQFVLPAVLIFFIVIVLDPHAGRIEMPFDPAHTASLYTVFMPNYAITRPLFDLIFDLTPQVQQSWGRVGNYIGIPSIFGLLALIVMVVRRYVPAGRKRILLDPVRRFLPYGFAGLLLLAFAMGWHFKITGQAWLELVPPIKQFVGLGRFAWAFYYVICVGTIILIASLQSRILRNSLLILGIGIYMLESLGYHRHLAPRIAQAPNVLSSEYPGNVDLINLIDGIDLTLYQAIIPLPFYHKYVTPGTFGHADSSIVYSMRLAYLTGKPLVSAVLSRPSVEEGRNIIQLFAPNQYEKPIREDIPDERPFLVLFTGDALHPMEQQFYNESEPMRHSGKLELRAIAHQSLFRYDHTAVGFEFLDDYGTMIEHPSGWKSRDSVNYIEFIDFSKTPAEQVYRGAGAWSGEIAQDNIIYKSRHLKAGVEYVLSFLYYNHLYDQLYNTMWIEEQDGLGNAVGKELFSPTANPLADRNWVWNEVRWTVKQNGGRIVLRSRGEARYETTFYVDEILLREAGTDVYSVIPDQQQVICVRNNQTVARMDR
jgi:hypothetical protein